MHLNKILFIVVLFVQTLFSDILEDKIKDIIGNAKYNLHQKLIENSFKDRLLYVSNGKINYLNVLEVLKNEGLLPLRLDKSGDIYVSFEFIGSKFKSLKNTKDILLSLGYTLFIPNEIIDNDKYLYNIRYKSKFLLDGDMFSKELDTIGAKIIDIKRISEKKWKYIIDFSNAKLYGAIKISANEKVQLKKPLKPYLIEIDGGKELVVLSQQLNKWYPKIAFFNKDLEYINSIEKTRIYKGVKITIPQETKYIQIGDTYSLINIKRGVKVIIQD